MDHFLYRDGVLHAEDVALTDIAEAVGTPFYVYSTATLTRHFHLFEQALAGTDHLVCFAVKALSNVAVLRVLARLGAGMDVVSGGEYRRARAAGVPGDRIVFSGVGKTREEMALVLSEGIRQINVESLEELRVLSEVAASMGATAPIALRVNPDVDAKTHEKIATGRKEDKFGVPIARAREIYAEAAKLPGIQVVGVDVHIGSQLTDLAPFEMAFSKIADLTRDLRADGHTITRLDLGGGLGIPYTRSNETPPLPSDYGAMVHRVLGDLDVEIEIEPGRLIAGNAGILVASVIYTKAGEGRDFLILDAAMNDLIRPAMYGAHHDIVPVLEAQTAVDQRPVDIVGPVCESGDTFAKARPMPPLDAGALVAFRSAGAYGAVMSSEYNTRPLIPEVLVDGDQFAVIRARPTFDEILARDTSPSWLAE
ncbi:MAG: diaminopimelate decarboxylase [Rhodobacteraceae bacterium]|nr:diaminopimelate decarboxylase [Paracoccaceae bacterium]